MQSFGGYNRVYEAPEIVRTVQPLYFKLEPGPSMAIYTPWASTQMLCDLAREKVKWSQMIHGLVKEHYPEGKMSKLGPKDLAIPKP